MAKNNSEMVIPKIPGGLVESEIPIAKKTSECVCGPEVRKLCIIDRIRPGSADCVKSR